MPAWGDGWNGTFGVLPLPVFPYMWELILLTLWFDPIRRSMTGGWRFSLKASECNLTQFLTFWCDTNCQKHQQSGEQDQREVLLHGVGRWSSALVRSCWSSVLHCSPAVLAITYTQRYQREFFEIPRSLSKYPKIGPHIPSFLISNPKTYPKDLIHAVTVTTCIWHRFRYISGPWGLPRTQFCMNVSGLSNRNSTKCLHFWLDLDRVTGSGDSHRMG